MGDLPDDASLFENRPDHGLERKIGTRFHIIPEDVALVGATNVIVGRVMETLKAEAERQGFEMRGPLTIVIEGTAVKKGLIHRGD